MADPSTTQAILVGIERYGSPSSIKDLNGPAKDVLDFCQWLRDKNVPAENISVFVSPLDPNKEIVDKINNLTTSKALAATKDTVNKALREDIKQKTASSFILFWSGHGWISPQGDRRLIFADATIENLKNLNLRAELNAMQTDLYKNLPQQLLIFDACANPQLLNITPPKDLPAIGTHLASQEQMIVFAANPGEYAINLGEGVFSRELLNELRLSQDEDSWLPDMEAVIKNVQQKFIQLREKGETKQTPSYWMYKDWSGNIEEQNFSEEAKIESESRVLTRVQKVEELRKALLKCSSIRNISRRKQIIRNLMPEISESFEPGGNAKEEVLNLIETCLDVQKGLFNLLQTMELLHEQGTIHMKNLWQKAKELFPEEVS